MLHPPKSEPPTDLRWLGVAEGSALLAAGRLSPLEWVDALLDQISRTGGPIAAFLHVAAGVAREQAREAGRELTAGRRLGPLHGVPYALKDLFDTAGMPTTGQSRYAMHRVPTTDATVVAALRAGGAVLLGKLATHEFAHGGPSLDLPWPPARNPWNPDHFTGSSSSGSGAALAAGLVPMALGTDTGGSVRIPAGMCGVVGLKPTYGLVSRRGVLPLAPCLDAVGPMARTVGDVTMMLQAIANHDPADPTSAQRAISDYSSALIPNLSGITVGVARHTWETDVAAHPDAVAAMEAALAVLRDAGATLTEVQLRPLRQYNDVRVIVQEPEAFALFQAALVANASAFGHDFLGRILPGCLVPAHVQVQAQRQRRRMTDEMRRVLDGCDVLVCLGAGPAPRFDAPLTHGFRFGLWSDRPNLTSPFSVTGFPALSVCNGFAANGLPLSMQIAARPFDEAAVLRVGHAYQCRTDWHMRHPKPLDSAGVGPITLAPEPAVEPLDARTQSWVDTCLALAGLRPSDVQREQVQAVAPQLLAMIGRIEQDPDLTAEPASVFRP